MTIPANRMNLLAVRQKMGLAKDGVDLLKNKREALIADFFQTADTIMDSREQMARIVLRSMVLAGTARAWTGDHQMKAAAVAVRREIPISTREISIWGIRIPVIEFTSLRRTPEARGLSPVDTPSHILEAAESYEELLERLLRTASQEIRLKRLGEEIRKVNRRINALEQSLIPSLGDEMSRIRQALEEREREDIFRLKHIKNRRARSFGG